MSHLASSQFDTFLNSRSILYFDKKQCRVGGKENMARRWQESYSKREKTLILFSFLHVDIYFWCCYQMRSTSGPGNRTRNLVWTTWTPQLLMLLISNKSKVASTSEKIESFNSEFLDILQRLINVVISFDSINL